jgi:hypothetical protein
LQCEVDGDGSALQFCDASWKTLERATCCVDNDASERQQFSRVHCGTTVVQSSFFPCKAKVQTRTAPSGARGILTFYLEGIGKAKIKVKKSRWRQERRAAGLDWDCDWDFFTGTGTRNAVDIMPLSNLSRWLEMCYCLIIGVTRRVGCAWIGEGASATDRVWPLLEDYWKRTFHSSQIWSRQEG